jgi:hypothetical protein
VKPAVCCSGCLEPISKVFPIQGGVIVGKCNVCGSEFVTHFSPPTFFHKHIKWIAFAIVLLAVLALFFFRNGLF